MSPPLEVRQNLSSPEDQAVPKFDWGILNLAKIEVKYGYFVSPDRASSTIQEAQEIRMKQLADRRKADSGYVISCDSTRNDTYRRLGATPREVIPKEQISEKIAYARVELYKALGLGEWVENSKDVLTKFKLWLADGLIWENIQMVEEIIKVGIDKVASAILQICTSLDGIKNFIIAAGEQLAKELKNLVSLDPYSTGKSVWGLGFGVIGSIWKSSAKLAVKEVVHVARDEVTHVTKGVVGDNLKMKDGALWLREYLSRKQINMPEYVARGFDMDYLNSRVRQFKNPEIEAEFLRLEYMREGKRLADIVVLKMRRDQGRKALLQSTREEAALSRVEEVLGIDRNQLYKYTENPRTIPQNIKNVQMVLEKWNEHFESLVKGLDYLPTNPESLNWIMRGMEQMIDFVSENKQMIFSNKELLQNYRRHLQNIAVASGDYLDKMKAANVDNKLFQEFNRYRIRVDKEARLYWIATSQSLVERLDYFSN